MTSSVRSFACLRQTCTSGMTCIYYKNSLKLKMSGHCASEINFATVSPSSTVQNLWCHKLNEIPPATEGQYIMASYLSIQLIKFKVSLLSFFSTVLDLSRYLLYIWFYRCARVFTKQQWMQFIFLTKILMLKFSKINVKILLQQNCL